MKRAEKFALGTLIVGVVLGMSYFLALALSTQRRDAALAKLHAVSVYKGGDSHGPSPAQDVVASVPGTDDVEPAGAFPRSQIEAFAELFRRAAFIHNDPEWGALMESVNGKGHITVIQQAIDPPAGAMPKLRTLMDSIQPLLSDVREAAEHGGPVSSLDFSRGIGMVFPDLTPMHNLARLLRADAIVANEQNDTQRIVDDIVTIMRLGDALASEPAIASQLVRIAIASIGFEALRFLPSGELDPEYYDQLIAAFEHSQHREEFAAAYGGQAAMVASFFENPPEDANWAGSADNVVEAGAFYFLSSPLGRPALNLDESRALETLALVQEIALLPLYQARPRLASMKSSFDNMPWWSFSGHIVTDYFNLGNHFEAQARHEEMMNLALMGLAVERIHGRAGAYPTSLNEIADQIPGGIPLRPTTGTPYLYTPGSDWFQLTGQYRYPCDFQSGAAAVWAAESDLPPATANSGS